MVSLYPMLQLYSRMVPCKAPLGVTTPCKQWYLVVCAQSVVLSTHLDCAVAGVRHVVWREAHHVVQRLAGQLGRLTYADRRLLGVPHSGAGAAVDVLPEQPQQRVALVAVVPAKFIMIPSCQLNTSTSYLAMAPTSNCWESCPLTGST